MSNFNRAGIVGGKVAVITGAGSGIGRAAALRLVEEGARIALIDVKEERVADVRERIVDAGGEAIAVEADVSKPADVERAMLAAADQWNRLDIVFANAGINGTQAPIESLTPEAWHTTLETNLTGTFLTVKYAIPFLKKQGGSIVITSSINGNRVFSNFGMSAYSTSKAGQVAFMQMAALELAQYGIRVNAVCPGAIQTQIGQNTHPAPGLSEIQIPVEYPEGDQPLEHGPGKASQVGDLVLFLSSDGASHITGTPIYIDGAESLLHG